MSKQCNIAEQIIEDPISGLTVQFEVMPEGDTRMRIFGDLRLGNNREFIFNGQGKEAGAGTATAGLCKPTWSQPLED